jgi:nucleotide-binding universal stress UspA family protein
MAATIIAAVDGSAAALQAARLLAGYHGDPQRLALIALNVQPRPLTLWPGPAIDARKMDDALLAQGSRDLEPARKLLAEAGLAPEIGVRLGVPAEWIAEEAERRAAALIVMGTRGHGPVGGFALGSVALRVAHRAQTPTLLVQADSRLPQNLGRSVRVLVPLDGSSHAARAVSFLLAAREWLGEVRVDLAHVRSAPPLLDTLPAEDRRLMDEWGSVEAEQATRDARARLYVAGVAQGLEEAAGDAPGQIVRLAGVSGSELIVMGTRGLGAVHHALIGSVALKVALASPVPVVLVP